MRIVNTFLTTVNLNKVMLYNANLFSSRVFIYDKIYYLKMLTIFVQTIQ